MVWIVLIPISGELRMNFKNKIGTPLIIGHRGLGPSKEENTLGSIMRAFDEGADEVECDLAISRDGLVFLHHNNSIKIMGKGRIPINRLDLSEMRTVKPDLATFDMLANHIFSGKLVLELKEHSDMNTIIKKIHSKFGTFVKKCRVISFSLSALINVKKIDPEIQCGYIATRVKGRFEPLVKKKHIQLCLEHGLEEISGHWLGFGVKKIEMARKSGLKVGLGFIDNKQSLTYCLRNNVEHLYTNRVGWIAREIAGQ